MGGLHNPDMGGLVQIISNRLRGLETQQQMTISNAQGLPVINIGQIGNTTLFGLQFIDPGTGEERMRIGELSAGQYGISYTDPAGNTADLLPQYTGFAAGPITLVGGTGAMIPTGAASTTAWIGSSGDAYVTFSAFLDNINFASGACFVAIDGVIYTSISIIATDNTTMTSMATVRLSQWVSGTLTPNTEHTFQMALNCSGSGTDSCIFTLMSVTVEPI